MPKTVIVVVGMPGAGKSEVSSFIKEQGIPMFRSGDPIREEVVKRGLKLTPENSEMIARKFREEFGKDAPVRIVMEKILKLPDKLVCVEGPRDLFELAYLEKMSRLVLLVVNADEDTRFIRLSGRASGRDPGNVVKGNRDPKSYSEFKWREEREKERGMTDVMKTKKYPRYEVENEGTIDDLHSSVLRVLDEIRSNMPKN